jgi:hypothetical protein
MASPQDEISFGHPPNKPENTPTMQRSDLSSTSAEFESLNFAHKSYVDADGTYRSNFRYSSVQSGSPLSRRSSRQVSGEGSPAAIIKSPGLWGQSSSLFTPSSPPEQSPVFDGGQFGRTPKTTPEPVGTTLSATAAFRKEIDNNDDAEVVVYGDPAGMAS